MSSGWHKLVLSVESNEFLWFWKSHASHNTRKGRVNTGRYKTEHAIGCLTRPSFV